MIVYISGRITGDSDFIESFARAEDRMEEEGHIVLNPCILPEGLSYDQYMDIDMAMIRACDAIYMISGWEGGLGSEAELAYAKCLKKQIISQLK